MWRILEEDCPYLEGRSSRLLFHLPDKDCRGECFDRAMEEGQRRLGPWFYQSACRGCQACQPLRIPVRQFRPSRSQRRVWRNNSRDLHVQLGRPRFSLERLELFNAHLLGRGLARS